MSSRRPDITFHHDGRIDISANIAKSLSIEPGDVIDIMQDGVEYYLVIRLKGDNLFGRHEAQCFPTKAGSNNYRCHSTRLSRLVISIAGAENRLRVMAGETQSFNGKTSITLIINSVKSK